MVERIQLASGLEISRILTGLWQIADMEREGNFMNPEEGALEMRRYVDAGLTTFDMADHYGTSELIAGQYEADWPGSGELLTKWVPKPGIVAREKTRAAVAFRS